MPTLRPKPKKKKSPASPSDKPFSARKDATEKAALEALHKGETAHYAVKIANQLHPQGKINKGDIQYYLMKANLPYLDEIVRGVRTQIK